MIKRKLVFGTLLGFFVALMAIQKPLFAQENAADVTIQQLRIQVMPEFDDPRVLVIAQGRLNVTDQELPRSVSFRIPLGAQINQMAAMDVSNGSTNPQTFRTEPDPADPRWTLVTFSLDSAHFFYEFYYDPFSGGRERDFAFVYSTLHPINDLQVDVQEPLRAEAFATEPAATLTRTDAVLGFNYHQFSPGALPAGDSWSINVFYDKADQDPSLSREAVMAMQNSQPSSVSTANLAAVPEVTGSDFPAGNILWPLAGFIMAALGGGAWVMRRRKSYTADPAPESFGTVLSTGRANFCPQCGAPAKTDARYCHGCGHELDG